MKQTTPALVRYASMWDAVDVAAAPAADPVAFGDDLHPDALLAAYQHGVYPFPADGPEHRLVNELTYASAVEAGRVKVLPGSAEPFSVAWCSPDPRPLILTGQVHLQRSLAKQLRGRLAWTTTVDRCFRHVVLRCRENRTHRWLTDELVAGLFGLHERGHAHSVEVWDGDDLVGGTFGVRTGSIFSADSQFTRRSGAAKVAVADLARRFAEVGGVAIDVQHDGDHVRRLGARPVPRSRYLELLRAPVGDRALPLDRLPARRLAE
ncbi:leucyl/phenylalanyl-tRNA--protein transferase [Micromonospora sp. BQ11]|uniref:leucyl/phenylalanyl-tRNA--protein transferase n=1 Tax=Micromonospora sp. BQ11 TaxID=3452212 RepID=UPI003F8A3AD3